MTLSAIVPVYNGAATLAQCLAPLAAMLRAGEIAELIVVDDGSTDDSAAVASKLGARVVASGGRLGPGGARNVGAQAASGDTLWFVDADVVVHADAARVLREAFARTGATAVFGGYDDAPPAANFLSQYKNLAHHYYHHREDEGPAETFWAGCGAVLRQAFLDAGGFDAARYRAPSIEDIELGWRLRDRGHAIRLVPALRATHLKAWRLGGLLHTDIFRRALPWSRLIQSRPRRAATLNIRRSERLRALLALGLAASMALALAGLAPAWLPLALLVAAGVANRRLLALFRRRRGVAFAVAALLFHQVYYLYASAAYAWSWVERRVSPAA
jgi:GT2 family glycosyltransferase